ncbi:unnamed protein product [Allacma fusca]|uniref:Ion transport domain-containing protein n=1 Tax=Allacma fusca TaxID=39272 RepID=A0A8J2NXP2_9HEXA|nr:unnamed protein product [Allacma fusca]
MAVFAALNIFLELLSICRHGIKYCKTIDTWVWIAMNISCLTANFFQITARLYKENTAVVSYALVNPSLANAVFMGWLYLVVMMRRFDAVGLYVSMFLEILKTLLRVLFVFSALIIAFTLAFFVLLSNGNHVMFSTFPLSFVRTFTMMLGDLDFMNSFYFPYHCDYMESNNRTDTRMYINMGECKYSRRVPHPYATFTMVCVFLVFIPIVMVNLLIGLAVGDIALAKKNAHLKRLSMQVQNHTNIEKFLPACLLRRVNKTLVVEYPNMNKSAGFVSFISRFSRHERNEDARQVPGVEFDDVVKCFNNVSSDVAEMKSMMSLLCSRLKIKTGITEDEEAFGILASQ